MSTTLHEERIDQNHWPCEVCPGEVYSTGFLNGEEWGRCRDCDTEQRRDESEDDDGNVDARDGLLPA